MRTRYPTDLSNAERECIEPYLTSPNKRGRPKTHSTREILDAIREKLGNALSGDAERQYLERLLEIR